MTLGEIIKDYRKTHEMSMGQFAEISGLSKAYISLLEKNQHPATGKPIVPTIQTIETTAKAMGMDVRKLIERLDDYHSIKIDAHYYVDPETARIAQEVFDDPNLRLLFDASRNSRPEDILIAVEMLKRFKENSDG